MAESTNHFNEISAVIKFGKELNAFADAVKYVDADF